MVGLAVMTIIFLLVLPPALAFTLAEASTPAVAPASTPAIRLAPEEESLPRRDPSQTCMLN